MNRIERPTPMPGEAQVEFQDGEFRVLKPGGYVRCAVTRQQIPIDDLKYWDVDRQEAYSTPQAMIDRLGLNVKL